MKIHTISQAHASSHVRAFMPCTHTSCNFSLSARGVSSGSHPLPPSPPPPPEDIAHLIKAIDAENKSVASVNQFSRASNLQHASNLYHASNLQDASNLFDLRPPSSLPNLRTHSSRLRDMDALRDKSSSAPLEREEADDVKTSTSTDVTPRLRRPKSEGVAGVGRRMKKGQNIKPEDGVSVGGSDVDVFATPIDVKPTPHDASPSPHDVNEVGNKRRTRYRTPAIENQLASGSVTSPVSSISLTPTQDIESLPKFSSSPPSKDTGIAELYHLISLDLS